MTDFIVVKSSASVKSVDFSSGFPSGGIFGFEGACPEGSSAMSMAGHTIVQVGQTHDGYMIYGYLMGARAGKQKVALTVTEIPSHQHGLSIEPDGSGGTGSISSGKHAPDRTWKTKAEGGGAYHENRMPYKVLNWCKQD